MDGEPFAQNVSIASAYARQCSYSADVPDGEHTVKIVVTGGTYTVDAIEY